MVNMVFFSLLSFCGNRQQYIMLLSQHFIIIQSDQDLCLLRKLMATIEYISGPEQSGYPDESVRMHRLILTFAIQTQ